MAMLLSYGSFPCEAKRAIKSRATAMLVAGILVCTIAALAVITIRSGFGGKVEAEEVVFPPSFHRRVPAARRLHPARRVQILSSSPLVIRELETKAQRLRRHAMYDSSADSPRVRQI
mmetsp:Transcript_6240/g.22177  ORF Transcript_6240/g.22177 Transcript_6240/m.22177 type:complete len:117 (-) Transcript_6240:1109-1459(-)